MFTNQGRLAQGYGPLEVVVIHIVNQELLIEATVSRLF